MSDWFHIEEVSPYTYVISEPAHWEEPHCYLLLGTERAILIDTGLGVSDIRKAVEQITSLPVFLVTTHVHWDHIGGHGQFESFAVHELEKEWISGCFPLPLDIVKHNLTCQPCDYPAQFDPLHYQIFQGNPAKLLRDGDVLELGGRQPAFLRLAHFAYCHFQLHYINFDFFFTFRAVQWEVKHHRICIYFCSSFSIADWAMNPPRFK